MSAKQPIKSRAANTVAEVNRDITSKTLHRAALLPVNPDGTIETSLLDSVGVFLINPSSYEDSKSTNWVRQTVPGQSDPVFQWVSGGERTLSFEALVTLETSNLDVENNKEPKQDELRKIQTKISTLASKFFSVNTSVLANLPDVKVSQLDISDYLDYYRSLQYPLYDDANDPKKLTASPPILVLYDGGSINMYQNGTGKDAKITPQHDTWVLTDLKIRVTKQLSNLAPMEAVVQFTLLQYNIKSFDRRRFSE